MHDGIVEQIGTPLELYDEPANLFVAEFIGSPAMNIVEGRIANGQFVASDGTVVPLGQTRGVVEGQAVKLGVRPEDLVLDEAGLSGTIVTIEPTGSETHVTLTVDGHQRGIP